jgi:OmcA/MtrC family decaheme c-type cytochrome
MRGSKAGFLTTVTAAMFFLAPTNPSRVVIRSRDGAAPPVYASNSIEHFMSTEEIEYIRPGFQITVNDITIGDDRKPLVDVSFTDDLNQPLDRAGQVTPGALSVSFILSWWDAGTRNYTAYTTRPQTSPITGNTAVQASADSGGTWTDISLGHATYKFGTTLPAGFDGTKTHTLGIYATRSLTAIIGKDYYANVEHDFRPDGADVTEIWDVLKQDETCNTCHNPLSAHGGSRLDVKLCVLCHSPQTTDPDTGNTVDFKVMIHKIHDGANLPSVIAGTPYQIIGHNQTVVDFSTVVFPQDIRNCTKCHGTSTSQSNVWNTWPSQAACGSCHDNVNFATGANHLGGPQFNDASCANCHEPDESAEWDPSIPGAHTVEYKSTQLHGLVMTILSVTQAAAGQKPVVAFQVIDRNGLSLDPRPFDTLQFTMGGPTTDYGVLPISENAQAGTSFDGTTATYTFQNAIPANATGTWAVTCDVELTVPLTQGDGKPDNTNFTESPLNPIFYIAITDAQPVPRRTSVDLANCNACHDHLAVHGGRRLNTQGCVICHNPINDDSSQRPADQGPPESISFQRMIHRIHSGVNLTQDYSIYGHGGRKVGFNEVLFPGDRRDCQKCHVPNGQQVLENPPAGQLPTITQRDWYTPQQHAAAACLGCHDTQIAASHVLSMTAPFGEACAACHGANDELSVDKVHAR